MTSLSEGLAVVKDFGLMTFLPAILIFAIVYAILSKTELLGDNPWANVLVAVVTSVLFTAVIKAVEFTNELLPLLAIAIVIIVFLWLILKFVGVDEAVTADSGKWGIAAGVFIIVFVLVVVAFKKVYNSAYVKIIDAMSALWGSLSDSSVLAIIVLFGIFFAASYAILKKGD